MRSRLKRSVGGRSWLPTAHSPLPTLFLCLFAFLFLPGCSESPQTAVTERPFEGVEVTVVVPEKHHFREVWEVTVNDWSDQTGARVTVSEVAMPPGESFRKAEPGNLVVFPATDLADWVASKALTEIPGTGEAERAASALGESTAAVPGLGWDEAWLGLREKLGSPGGKASVLPISTPTLVLYYREDLLSKAGLAPPTTWDEYQELVTRLPQWAPGKSVAEPWSPAFRATMFLARAVPAVQHPSRISAFFDVETGAPLIDSEGYVRTLEQVVKLFQTIPEESRRALLELSPEQCRDEIVAGRAALAIGWERGPEDSRKEVSRPEQIVVGVARLPGAIEVFNPNGRTWDPAERGTANRVTLIGFDGYAVAVRGPAVRQAAGEETEDRATQAAWHLAGRLWSTDNPSPQPAGTSRPFREADLADVSRFIGAGLQGDEAQAYAMAVADSLRERRMVVELPVPSRAEYRAALTRGLAAAIGGQSPPADALRDVSGEWRKITDRIGMARLRETYRCSLGL